MTKAQLRDVVDNYVKKHNKFPSPKELATKVNMEFTTAQCRGYLMKMKSEVPTLNVLNGKVFTQDGETIWFRNSAGSLVPARFKVDPQLGPYVTG